ncbi:hypothetical protein NE237_023745 [Protea cynaroides]|uniref:Uncharacterized protein n=1 Tax=Protea cynaroides TaxID=273540 RepID=A0A9Q0HEK2_9MAGN|nr:hypothetical protein NE237_023745 [Protea cynaroides]
MFRQSLSRNQRSKGIKVKHVLQICLLLAISIWLLYQLKNSQDKKKEILSTPKILEKVESEQDIIKLGRKDLHPRVEDSASEIQRQNDEETEEGGNKAEEEEEENKPQGGQLIGKRSTPQKIGHELYSPWGHDLSKKKEEEKNKPKEAEEEGRSGRDDEIDEHNKERAEEEVGHAEDSFDEGEKDREEKENEQVGLNDGTGISEDQDHDGGERSTQDAREEIYNGDDASSAVVRIPKKIEDSGGLNMEEQVENVGNNELEHEKKFHSIEELELELELAANENDSGPKMGEDENVDIKLSTNATDTEEKMGEDENVGDNPSANATAIEERGTKGTLVESEVGSTSNSKMTKESSNQIEVNDSSTADNAKSPTSSLQNQNATETITDPTQHQNASEASRRRTGGDNVLFGQVNSNTTDRVEKSETISNVALNTDNSTVASREPTDSSGNSSNVVPEVQAIGANVTTGTEDGSASLTINENAELVQREKTNETSVTDENKDGSTSSMTNENENANAIQHDLTDSSILQEVKEARTDLGTLPETKTEGTNHDDMATK